MKVKCLISIFVVVALLTCFVVFPVSADIDSDLEDGKLLNLLDYGNSLESEDNYQTFLGSSVFTYELPSPAFVSYVDIIFYYNSSSNNPISSCNLLRNGSNLTWLNFLSLGNGLFKAVISGGNFVSRSFDTIGIELVATDSSQNSYASILSFDIGLYNNVSSHVNGKCTVTYEDGSISASHKPSSHAQVTWSCNGSYDDAGYAIDLYTSDFWKYDFLDFTFLVYADTIDSLTVSSLVSGSVVPFEVSFIDSSLTDASAYLVQVRVDLSNYKSNDSADVPCIMLWGVSHYPDILNAIIVSDIVGHIKYEYENPVIFWFKKTFSAIGSGFSSVVNAITGNSAAAEQVGENMKEAANDLTDMGGAFDQVDTPDIDAAALTGGFTNFSPSGLTVLSTITGNSYVTALLALVFTFALCAYIFFGRKR